MMYKQSPYWTRTVSFSVGRKIDLDRKTTPMGIKENELSSVTRNLIPNIRVYFILLFSFWEFHPILVV